ncbi:MAG: amino acid ABC transporter permease [Burkholderiales bacterium]|nr:amino acid ABC transporter permease [Anaerolineae bacterium]
MQTIINSGPLILRGLLVTLEVSALVLFIGTIIGIGGGLALLYGAKPLRWLVRAYVDTLRGIPLLVLIFALFYGMPVLGLQVSALTAAVIALSIFCGAHVSEIVRGGAMSISSGQTDAANALGLSFGQRLRYVILPQALRRVLPPWVNTAAEMVKASSLVSLVSVVDLMMSIQQIAGRTRETLLLYGVAALLYFLVNFSISTLGRRLEKRFAYS